MPTFTKQHYNKFVELLNKIERLIDEQRESGDDSEPYLTHDVLYSGLMEMFKKDNPRFDEDRFHKACFPSAYDTEGNKI